MDRAHQNQAHSYPPQGFRGQASGGSSSFPHYVSPQERELQALIQPPLQRNVYASPASTAFTHHSTLPAQPAGHISQAEQTMSTYGQSAYPQQEIHADPLAPTPCATSYVYPVTHVSWQSQAANWHGYEGTQFSQAVSTPESYPVLSSPGNLNARYQSNSYVTGSAATGHAVRVDAVHAAHQSMPVMPAASTTDLAFVQGAHSYSQPPQEAYWTREPSHPLSPTSPSSDHSLPSPKNLPRNGNADDTLCRFCQKGPFGRPYELKRHEESVHQPPKHECKLCGDRLKRKDDLRRHIRTQHPPQPF